MARNSNTFVDDVLSDVTKSKKDALTANGAVTRSTTGKAHLDLFAIIGAARNDQSGAVSLFSKAYADDKELAIRILLWARDVRGGAGERQVFRNIIRHMCSTDPNVVDKIIPFVPVYGRWDDMIESIPVGSHLFIYAATELKLAIERGDGNAAKWAPRKGTVAVALRESWDMTPKQYRRFVVDHTKVVETLMCNKQWDAIEFDKLPSLAGLRYQAAFTKNVPTSYAAYKGRLVKGETKINVGTLFPHNIVNNIRNGNGDGLVLNEQWKALPDYLGEHSGKVLVMADVSTSMQKGIGGSVSCMDVSIALGIYTSERLKGEFKDLVLTFSANPTFHKITGNSLSERISNLEFAHWGGNTDLQKAFELVLHRAKIKDVPQEDMPETIIVVSDMDFDAYGNKTNLGGIKEKYADAGYKIPQLVFWNVNGRAGNNPAKHDAQGVAMISGFSPAILTSVLNGEQFDPMKIMLNTVMKQRYDVAEMVV